MDGEIVLTKDEWEALLHLLENPKPVSEEMKELVREAMEQRSKRLMG